MDSGLKITAAVCAAAILPVFSPSLTYAQTRPADPTHMPLTVQSAKDIAAGNIRLEGSRVDYLLYGRPALDPAADDDHDGLTNADELYTYRKDGKVYYGYNTHPRLEDTDGDGIPDGKDANPLVWDISARDMALFMELVYREDAYITKVLNNREELTDLFKDRAEYRLMHNELSPFWKVKRFIHKDTGFDAAVFETKSDVPYLPDGKVQVLAVRGTQGATDVIDDFYLSLGHTIDQIQSMNETLREMNASGFTNVYITGHSLGGYLTQCAMAEADEKGYTWVKRGYTFNAPRIKGNAFNRKLWEISDRGDRLTQQKRSIHYKVSNDSTIHLIGNMAGAIDVGQTQRGHSSRSYFEKQINNIAGFTVGKRANIDGVGYLQPNVMEQKVASVTDSDVYRAKLRIAPEETDLNGTSDLTDNVQNRRELPSGTKYEDITDYKTIDFGRPGRHTGRLRVTYPDRSISVVPVDINVRQKMAEIISVPETGLVAEIAERFGRIDLTDNVTGLPGSSRVEVVKNVSSLHPGDFVGQVKVIFLQGTRLVNIPVHVKEKKLHARPAEIFEGDRPDLTGLLAERNLLPSGTAVSDATDYSAVNLRKAGSYTGRLKVRLPDGSSEYVDVPITVKKKPQSVPGAAVRPIPVIPRENIIPETVRHFGRIDLTDNVKGLPAGARVEVVQNVSSARTGKFTGRVRVVFAQGESRIVDIPVEVAAVHSVPDNAPSVPALPEGKLPSPTPNPSPAPDPVPPVSDSVPVSPAGRQRTDVSRLPQRGSGFAKSVKQGEKPAVRAEEMPRTGTSPVLALLAIAAAVSVGFITHIVRRRK